MVHTLPPWTMSYRNRVIHGLVDNGELAARLQSPVKYDRRGDVVFMDDFEGSALHWSTGGGGANNVQALSTAWARDGSQSCILTAGEGVLGQAYIYKYLGIINPGKVGLECSFTMNANTTTFVVAFLYYDGTNLHRGAVRYDNANSKWEYLDSTATYQDLLTSVVLRTTNSPFHTCKLVFDTDKDEYERFLYNNVETSMDGISIYKTADATDPLILIQLIHVSTHASVQSIYVDNVILTQNEP